MENKLRYMGGVICAASSVDSNTQNLSAFNIIDQINVDLKAKDPTTVVQNSVEKINIPANFQVISLWKRKNLSDIGKEVDGKIQIEILDPLGNILAPVILDIKIPKNIVRTRYVMNINGFAVTISGEYSFQIREIFSSGERSEILATLGIDVTVSKT